MKRKPRILVSKKYLATSLLIGAIIVFTAFIASRTTLQAPENSLLFSSPMSGNAENAAPREITYNEFLSSVQSGKVESVNYDLTSETLSGKLYDGGHFTTANPQTEDFRKYLLEHDIIVVSDSSLLKRFFSSNILLYLILAGVLIYMIKSRQNVGNLSAEKLSPVNEIEVTFDDVAGNYEAIENLKDLSEFIQYREKYISYGVSIPRGTILFGPPGTGKTLMAKALAGTTGVSFLSVSGSDFVEKYVGLGASRVRELFKAARKNAPCIVFIDEIDAMGKKRGRNNSHDEREQTLNQLLVEMDGFSSYDNIMVTAATNRLDTLDEALLRAGRFDRHIYVGLPDLEARHKILQIHAKNRPLSSDINLLEIARITTLMSGADLSNIMNEAGIHAVKQNFKYINKQSIEHAIEKLTTGEKRKTSMSMQDKKITAYHEAGHALIALLQGKTVPKVSIIPTTKGSGGYTMVEPEEKAYNTRKDLIQTISVFLGGRAAEELIFGPNGITNGAEQDLRKATKISVAMIEAYGMSKSLTNYSECDYTFPEKVAEESERIINQSYKQVKTILKKNSFLLQRIAIALLKNETLEDYKLEKIVRRLILRNTQCR